jgi:large repetitive protein
MSRLVSLATLVLALIAASPAAADTYTVTSNADLGDADTGDGVCQSSNGECTLRAAVDQANATPADDAIDVPAGPFDLTGTANEDSNARWAAPQAALRR